MPRISGFVIVKIVLENQADGIINGAERELVSEGERQGGGGGRQLKGLV